MQHRFPAHRPVELYVELKSGDLTVNAREVDHAVVDVVGARDDQVDVTASDDRIQVTEPRHTGFSLSRDRVSVTVTVPIASTLVAKLGSASIRTNGTLGPTRVSTGSGDIVLDEVAGPASVRTGSGQISVRAAEGGADVKAGSGDIRIDTVEGDANLVTGSGDVLVSRSGGRLNAKSGSGDLVLEDTSSDAALTTASGDLEVRRVTRGQVRLRNVSGDIRLGIPAGTPVWTDISTGTGHLHSDLTPTGAPTDGQDYVEVRAQSVTGDIYLQQIQDI